MVWCGMVQCTTGGFGMVMDKTDTQEAALAAAACSQFCAIAIAAFAFAEATYQDRRLTLYQWRV